MRRSNFLSGLMIASGIGLIAILYGLWKPIFWAVIFAILFRPLCARLTVQFKGRASLASVTTILLLGLFVLIPAVLLGSSIVSQAVESYDMLETRAAEAGAYIDRLETQVMSYFGDVAGVENAENVGGRIEEAILGIGTWFVDLVLGAGQGAALFVVNVALMGYLLFFLLRDGVETREAVFDAIPLPDKQKKVLFERFALVAVATIKGTLVVSVVQGILGGIAFAALGIQGAVFWGAVMAVVAILPALGATLVWLPTAILLIIAGAWVKGIILILFGSLVIAMVDNVLRPILVGRDTKLPDYLILFTTVGGITLMGITGFVAGPIIAALFLVAWQLWATGYIEEEDDDEPVKKPAIAKKRPAPAK